MWSYPLPCGQHGGPKLERSRLGWVKLMGEPYLLERWTQGQPYALDKVVGLCGIA